MVDALKTCNNCRRDFYTEQDFLSGTERWRRCSEGHLWFNCRCGSTLMLKNGKFDWYSPQNALSEPARGVFNRLGNLKDLPGIPHMALMIQQQLDDPNVSPKDISQEIRKEPVLATQVLQVAENIRNTRNPGTPPIRALEHAIVYMGFKTLKDLLITSSLRTIPLPTSEFPAEAFWTESLLTGSIAESVARRYASHLAPDEAFLAGSLCNIGKLVLAVCFPPLATKISREVAGTATNLIAWRSAEQSYSFPDHCTLGEIATTLWGFPNHIVEAARYHHTPPATTSNPLSLSEIVAIANQMLHWVLLRPHRMEYLIVDRFAIRARITSTQLDALALDLTRLKQIIALSGATV